MMDKEEVKTCGRILGVDPGSRFTGFAVIEPRFSNRPLFCPQDFKIVDAGVFRAKEKDPAFKRIGEMYKAMLAIMRECKPKTCVLEGVFLGKNVKSALMLGQVRGAFVAASHDAGVGVDEVAPTTVKKIIAGRGGASKGEVELALKAHLGFDRGNLPQDVTDALAIALSYSLKKVWMTD